MLKLLLLCRQLRLLLGDDAATAASFIELRKADVESAQHRQNQNCEGDDLCAGIYLTHQFARELAQKYFGIVAARRRRSFHRGLLDEWRDVRTIAAPRYQRR